MQIGDRGPEPIRISKHEAMSPHVDDLLARQHSLKGERRPGGRVRRAWWYQSWFVLMLVGGLAAFAAWAIIEPRFDDLAYVQGRIEELYPPGSPPPSTSVDAQLHVPSELRAKGVVTVRGEQIWLPFWAMSWKDGRAGELASSALRVGDRIGVWCEVVDGLPQTGFAEFVELEPEPLPEGEETKSLYRQQSATQAMGLISFALIAGLVGLAIGAADGIVCRLPRRAAIAGGLGLLIGFVGGFVASILAELVYMPLNSLAAEQTGESFGSLSGFGFFLQVVGRGLAWMLAGTAMGLAQGIVLRSKRLLLYGLLGGVLGGLLGGLLFDPIDLLLLGPHKPSAHISRMVGFTVIGLTVGAMIGVVELLARDAWLRMTRGPLQGKEFLVFKDLMRIGSSPRSDVYLFNDDAVVGHHADLRTVGDAVEIQNLDDVRPVRVNGRPVRTTRLRHGDVITIGTTEFVYEQRKG